jgi:hypothetical protein
MIGEMMIGEKLYIFIFSLEKFKNNRIFNTNSLKIRTISP